MYLKRSSNSKWSLSVKPGLVSIAKELIQFQKLVVENTNLANFLRDGQHFVTKIIAISYEYFHYWRKIDIIFVFLPWKLDNQYCHNVYGQRTRAGIRSTHGRRNVWGRGGMVSIFFGRLSIPIPNGGRLCPPRSFVPTKIFEIPISGFTQGPKLIFP